MPLATALIALFRAKGYRLAENAGEVNIAYVEGAQEDGSPRENKPNEWNDRRVVFTAAGEAAIVHNALATSEPGKFYTENPLDPGGAARIALGQHLAAWRVGIHNAGKPSAHEALVQCGTISIYRDKNQDYSRAGDQMVVGGNFGINQHHGWNMPVDDIGRASAGCLVGRAKVGHLKFMQLVKADPRCVAEPKFAFDTAVIEAAEIQSYLGAEITT